MTEMIGQIEKWIEVIALTLSITSLYFLPTIIAAASKLKNAAAIIAINTLLGWTLLGWVGALVWTFVGIANKKEEITEVTDDMLE